MGGLRWWAQTHWMREQRRQWREHDARLATLWHAGADVDEEPERVIVLPDVIVLPEVIVTPGVIRAPEPGVRLTTPSS